MASFLTECQVTLSKDPANYVTDAHGKSVLKPEISDDVCSVFCHQHGHCVRGKCICDAGYAGDNCHLVAGQGPQLDRIRRFVLIVHRWRYRVPLESRVISQYASRIRFGSFSVTASYGHYGHTADRIFPGRIYRISIRLPASDSALFFQRKP